MMAYVPEYVSASVAAHEACLVVFQDAYCPGREAFIDGEERSLIRTDVGFRTFEVDPAEHAVVMKYRPASLRIGTLLGCAAVLAGVLYPTGSRLLLRLRGPVQRGK
jgi:uncharacterized membrane protein YfhO